MTTKTDLLTVEQAWAVMTPLWLGNVTANFTP